MIALLDVSILVTLFDPSHVHHQIAHDWFEDQKPNGWATCPVTENGFVRIATGPIWARPPHRPGEIIQRLTEFRRSPHHHFWSDTISLTDIGLFDPAFIHGHRQITDVYLLGLATSVGGAFATLDQSVPLKAVKRATKANLIVLSGPPEESSSEDS